MQLLVGFTVPLVVAISTPLPCPAQQGLAVNGGSTKVGATSVMDDAYTLGPGDRVRIDVLKLTQFSGEFQVLADGALNLPQAGNISVSGMTLKEAENAISQRVCSDS